MNDKIYILQVFDNAKQQTKITEILMSDLKHVECVPISTVEEFDEAIQANYFHIVITDFKLKWSNGIKVLQIARDLDPDCPVIIFGTVDKPETIVRAMKAGLYDYIRKSEGNLKRLALVTKRAIKMIDTRIPEESVAEDAQYSSWFEGIPSGLFTFTPDGQITSVNVVVSDIFGFNAKDVISEYNFYEMIVDKNQAVSLKTQFEEQGLIRRFEVMLEKATGEIIWVEVNGRMFINDQDNPTHFECSIYDITLQKTMAEALKEGEEKFRHFTSGVTDVLYRYDPVDNQYDFISPSIEKLTGYSQEKFMDDPKGMAEKIVHPDDLDIIFNNGADQEEKRSNGGFVTREYRIITAEGKERYVNDRLTFELDDEEIIYRINGVMRDVTQRILAQAEIEREKQFSENVIETAKALIVILDPYASIMKFNSFAEKLTGYDRNEVKGKNWFDLFVPEPERKAKLFEFSKQMKEGEVHWSFEDSISCKDQALLQVQWENSILRDDSGARVGVLSIGIDITQHRLAERDKLDIQAQLYKVQKFESVGLLTSGITHKFNNLLTSIMGYTDLMLMGADRSNPVYTDLKKIREVAVSAADLARKIHQLHVHHPTDIKNIDLTTVINAMTEMLKPMIGKDIKLSTKMPRKLWMVKMNPDSFEQVMMNIAVNAKQAMPDGGTLTIKAKNLDLRAGSEEMPSFAVPGKYIQVIITDTGKGMSESLLKGAFEPFSQDDGKQHRGLGLPVSYGIIRQFNGWIDAESKPGAGTILKIYLPAVVQKTKFDAGTGEGQPLKGAGKRILIIENEINVRELAIRALEKHGFTVMSATNSREAMDIFIKEDGNFHLIFCTVALPDCNGIDLVKSFQDIRDIVLPDYGGVKLVKSLKKKKPKYKILLTCEQSKHWAYSRSRDLGKFDLIPKPYYLDNLVQKVEEILAIKD